MRLGHREGRRDTGSDGQNRRFAELLRRHQIRLFGYIFSLVRNLDDAEDLFQQTSLVLWDKFAQFDPSRSFLAWACGVARFEVADFLRSRSRRRLSFGDEVSLMLAEAQEDIDHEELEERRDALAGCLKKLRPRDQALLQECYDGSTRIPEIAEARGRSSQSIHNSLRRIRRLLSDCVRRTLADGGIA